MNQQSTSGSAPAGHIFSGGGTLYFARLMRPEEVAKATRNYPVHVQENIAGHWMLCSDVSKQMFGLLKQAPKRMFPTRLTAFRSSSGVCYGVLTHQISGHQHRFLTVLSDPSVRLFLQSMTKERLGFMLGNDNSAEALVLECPLQSTEFLPLLAMSIEAIEAEQRESIFELPLVLEAMTNPLQVPSLFGGQAVHSVNVSLLLPSVLDEKVRDALREATRK